MTGIMTSRTHPLCVDWLPVGPPGRLGLTLAPGKTAWTKGGKRWQRDLLPDLDRLVRDVGAQDLVCLLEDHELRRLQIPDLARQAERRGLHVHRLPIPDGGVLPDVAMVEDLVVRIVAALEQDRAVVVHCAGGLGRSGTIAGCVLARLGHAPADALAMLHEHRSPRCPENRAQERFIEQFWESIVADRPGPRPQRDRRPAGPGKGRS